MKHAKHLPRFQPPSNLITSPNSVSISLNWRNNADYARSIRIERSPNGSTSWVEIDFVNSNQSSYTDVGLNSGSTQFYRIRARTGTLNTAYSGTSTATTTSVPTTYGGFSFLGAGADQDITSAPWMAQVYDVRTGDFITSAAIIDVNWVICSLTAVNGIPREDLVVRYGGTQISAMPITVAATEFVGNTSFSQVGNAFHDNIAMIKIPTITPSASVAVIPLDDGSTDYTGFNPNISGWGWVGVSNILSDTLQLVTAETILDNATANSAFLSGGQDIVLISSELSVYDFGVTSETNWGVMEIGGTLVGLGSYSVLDVNNRPDPLYPQVYSKISEFQTWIADVIANN